MEGVGGAHSVITSTFLRAPCRFKTQAAYLPGSRICKASAQGKQGPSENISSRPLPASEASCGGKHRQAVRKAKIDLHARMWLLLPKCGPDARLPGEDSRDATASFVRPHCFSPDGEASLLVCFLDLQKEDQKEHGRRISGNKPVVSL